MSARGKQYRALIELLRQELPIMKPQQEMYELIRKEMKARGRWKALNRGSAPPSG